ncbi:hypothetical protein JAAARDRAFT_678319 [Jaapia argillacea MUCL 33604]|uniref:Uncharacterized protein n=1 Tax=Jaapia argillacea MUCL 33604 TaxID=933084 RepID=A0A067PXW1_9AGAM|nr:hypothetical protein JAAARDRAFT_678319 [Jaapia argillacea MUCL 33604]
MITLSGRTLPHVGLQKYPQNRAEVEQNFLLCLWVLSRPASVSPAHSNSHESTDDLPSSRFFGDCHLGSSSAWISATFAGLCTGGKGDGGRPSPLVHYECKGALRKVVTRDVSINSPGVRFPLDAYTELSNIFLPPSCNPGQGWRVRVRILQLTLVLNRYYYRWTRSLHAACRLFLYMIHWQLSMMIKSSRGIFLQPPPKHRPVNSLRYPWLQCKHGYHKSDIEAAPQKL